MKRSRSSHLRLKITALLAALIALWAFAAVVTVREGLNVLFVDTVDHEVARPSNFLVGALQQERRVSMVALAVPAVREQLEAVRVGTDGVLASWQQRVGSSSLRLAASEPLKERIAEAAEALAALEELRRDIDSGEAQRQQVLTGYTRMIETGFAIYSAIAGIDDQEIARQVRTLVTLTRSREILSQQDALLAGALPGGELSAPEITQLTGLITTQRFLYSTLDTELDTDLDLFQAAMESPELSALRDLEDRLLADVQAGATPPITAAEWEATIGPAMRTILEMEIAAGDRTLARANDARTWVIVRLLLAGGLGMIAVLAAVVISITTARSLIRQLERLRDAARDLARYRLPRVVERLSAGETVDVATEAPPLRFGDDEIGQVGQAFNAVQETAVRAAVQQAELRHGIRDIFLSLARRTQNLVHKQLSVLDAMERRETDADEMEEIYRVDHLATRMRRNAENLIVLSGANPGRTWRRPVPMIDVVRGAVAEVEDYTRVGLMPVEPAAMEGRAVGDTIHLLAELIENAASYSPPYAKVSVSGQRVAHGFVIEIEDRGLGMSEAELAAANEKLSHPPDFSLADASRLGHYVVAKLSQRHGIRVHLRTSPYGGIVAIVLIPNAILASASDGGGAVSSPPTRAPADPGPGGGPAALPVGSNGAAAPAPTPEQPSGFPMVRQRQATLAPPIVGRPAPGQGARHRLDHAPEPTAPPVPAPEAAGTTLPLPTLPSAGSGLATPGSTAGAPVAGAAPGQPTGGAAPVVERRTPAGLPWRVRQASLPKEAGEGDAPLREAAAAGVPQPRDPEQVRQMMTAYQRGTLRGRSDGAAAPAAGSGPPGGDPPTDLSGPPSPRPAPQQEG